MLCFQRGLVGRNIQMATFLCSRILHFVLSLNPVTLEQDRFMILTEVANICRWLPIQKSYWMENGVKHPSIAWRNVDQPIQMTIHVQNELQPTHANKCSLFHCQFAIAWYQKVGEFLKHPERCCLIANKLASARCGSAFLVIQAMLTRAHNSTRPLVERMADPFLDFRAGDVHGPSN